MNKLWVECSQEKNLLSWVRRCVFSRLTHHRTQLPKSSTKPCVKESQHAYLFYQCFRNWHFFGNSYSHSHNYCNGVFLKLQYLNSYGYIFNTRIFIVSLKNSHFGSQESMPVSYQNNETSKEIGGDISISNRPLYFVQSSSIFCYSINFYPSIF